MTNQHLCVLMFPVWTERECLGLDRWNPGSDQKAPGGSLAGRVRVISANVTRRLPSVHNKINSNYRETLVVSSKLDHVMFVSVPSWASWAGRARRRCCRKNPPAPSCCASARATKTEPSPSAGWSTPTVVRYLYTWSSTASIYCRWNENPVTKHLTTSSRVCLWSSCRAARAFSAAIHQGGAGEHVCVGHHLPLQPESPEEHDQEPSALSLPRHPQRRRLWTLLQEIWYRFLLDFDSQCYKNMKLVSRRWFVFFLLWDYR